MAMLIHSLKSDCESLYIPQSRDVLKCSHPHQLPQKVPQIWEAIYDNTANEFGFKLEKGLPSINIQIYDSLPPVKVTEMYKLKLN